MVPRRVRAALSSSVSDIQTPFGSSKLITFQVYSEYGPTDTRQDFCRAQVAAKNTSSQMQGIIAQRTREKASLLWYLPWKGQEQISGLVQMGGPHGPREGSLTAGLRNTRPPLLGPLWGRNRGGRGGNHSAHWKKRALRVTRSVVQTPASSLCSPGYVTSPLNLLPCLQTRAGNCRVVDSLSRLGFLAWVTCSRIIRVAAVISLIKGRCGSGRRDSNTRAPGSGDSG